MQIILIFSLMCFSESLRFHLRQNHLKEISGIAIAIPIFLNHPFISVAQIPLYEDYDTGKVVRLDKIKKTVDQSSGILSIDSNTFNSLRSKLDKLETLSKQNSWDDVLREIKDIAVINKKYFGLDSIQSLAKSMDIDEEASKKIEILRDDLRFSVGQLSDFAISSRVIYFNSEDLKLVKQMAEDGDTLPAVAPSLDEALSILGNSKEIVMEMSNVVK